jgi:protein SCO1
LKDFYVAGKPLLLTLNYYGCGTLCSVQLNQVLEGLKGLSGRKPDDFSVLTVSFDKNDTAEVALERELGMAAALKDRGFRWSFTVASQDVIDTLTSSVGFQYKYDDETKQFAHSAAVFFLSPDGTLTRYLYGVNYSPRDMNFSILDAGLGKVGSTAEKLILRCFHFDIMSGKYTPFALNTVRTVSILCALVLFGFMFRLWRSEIRRNLSNGQNVGGFVRGT